MRASIKMNARHFLSIVFSTVYTSDFFAEIPKIFKTRTPRATAAEGGPTPAHARLRGPRGRPPPSPLPQRRRWTRARGRGHRGRPPPPLPPQRRWTGHARAASADANTKTIQKSFPSIMKLIFILKTKQPQSVSTDSYITVLHIQMLHEK